MITSRPATLTDFRTFYEREPPQTFRAIVVESTDGDVVGFGGYWIEGGVAVAFSDIKDLSKKDTVRAAHHLHDFLRDRNFPVIAPPASEEYGDTAMRHFGFEPVGDIYIMGANTCHS